MKTCILDAGPLLAYLNKSDRHHAWAVARMAEVQAPLLTCEGVIAEVAYHLASLRLPPWGPLVAIERGVIQIDSLLGSEAGTIAGYMQKYHDLPMDFVDGCLLRMLEKVPGSFILTIDGDFFTYRKHGREAVEVVHPGA